MVFAPKLNEGISYERPQQVAPPVDYGKALTSGVSDVLKVLDDVKPDQPTWSQVKDEKEWAGQRAFSRELAKVDQLLDQGQTRAAAARGRALVDMAAEMGINMADPQIAAQFKARGITLDTLGETPEDTHNRKKRETPAYQQAQTLVLTDPKYNEWSPQQKQDEIERMANQRLLDEETINRANQLDATNWYKYAGPALARTMKLNVEAQVLEAQTAARLGIQIDPTSLEAKHTEITYMLAQLQSVFPAGLPESEKEKSMATLKGALTVLEQLQKRGEGISAGTVANLTAALSDSTDPKSTEVVALLADGLKNLTPDVIDLILNQREGSVAEALKILANPDAKTFYFGAGKSQWGYGKRVRKPGVDLRKTLEEPDAGDDRNAEKIQNILSPDTLRQNEGSDPLVHLENFNKNMLTLGELISIPKTEDAAAFNLGLAANAAAAVYNSTETFSAAEVKAGYGTQFFKNMAGMATLYPGQAGAMVQAHLLAVIRMGAKASARLESVTKGWLQYSGTTLLLDYDKITTQEYSVGGSLETRLQMKAEVKAAVEAAGGFSEFLKDYDSFSKGQKGPMPYSSLVKAFMMSKEVQDIRKDMSPILEQTKAVVALSQTGVRLQRLQDKIAKDLDELNFNNEVPDGEHSPLRPDEVRVNPAFTNTSAAVPDTNGVSLGGPRVDKVSDALISPAAAGTLDNLVGTVESARSYDAVNRGTLPDKGIIGSATSGALTTRSVQRNGTNVLVPISGLTIDELTQFQSIKDPNDTSRVFAAGFYQIIPDTMAEFLKAHPEVKGSDVFDPAMQDKVFNYLIYEKRKDIGKYISGKSGDRDAALLALAKEWASFPVPTDMVVNRGGKQVSIKKGESYYGQGNKASVTVEQAGIALDGMIPDDELPESQIMDTVTQNVPDATPEEVKEVIDYLQGANTLDAIRALGARQRAIMSAILNAYSEEEQQQPEQPAASSTVGSGPYRQPTPTPLGE